MGMVIGANLTSNFQPFSMTAGSDTGTQSLLGGLSAEWRFSGALSAEADGLYRSLHTPDPPYSAFSVVTWEFPVLAKYRLALPHLSPFVEAGPSFRAAGNLNNIHPSHYGFTAGVGVARHVGRWTIEPALRYTHWAQDLHPLETDVRTKPDQLEVLIGFHAPPLSNGQPWGGRFSLGAVAGTSLTSDFSNVTSSTFPPALANSGYIDQVAKAIYVDSAGPRSFVGGALFAVNLPKRFSVEVEGICRPLRNSVEGFLVDGPKYLSYEDHRTTWEFPLLAQRRWRLGHAVPFIEMGPAFRLLQDVYGAAPYGVAAGAGIETRVGRFKIAPGLRFTHWAQHDPPQSTDPKRSELALLTGFSL